MLCSYCGEPADTVDHIVSRAEWAEAVALELTGHYAITSVNDPDNLTPACRSCNAGKNRTDLDQWLLACILEGRDGRHENETRTRVGIALGAGTAAPWVTDRAARLADELGARLIRWAAHLPIEVAW